MRRSKRLKLASRRCPVAKRLRYRGFDLVEVGARDWLVVGYGDDADIRYRGRLDDLLETLDGLDEPGPDADQLDDETLDVLAFAAKFGLIHHVTPGHLTKRKLDERVRFLQEELDELRAACERQDLAAQADALVDLVYVAKGTALMLGLPWNDLWREVQRSNMAKVRRETRHGDHKVGVMKPENWQPPQLADVLTKHGYDRERWYGNANLVHEGERDDADV
jgi:NTP pyrophosphatase (non-canonical NTP hydrolase)